MRMEAAELRDCGRLKDIRAFIDDCTRTTSMPSAWTRWPRPRPLAVAMIGQALAQARGLVTKHAIKQVNRLLSNGGIDVWESFARWCRIRPARQISHFSLASKGPFSSRVSLVNSLLLSSVAAPGSRFSPRSEGSAATSGSKYKRCNVHNGLAWCRYVAQGRPAQPPAPSPRWATITPEATLRMDLSEGPVSRPPADRTSGMARPSARCCA